ncbi:MAG: hypothetical protein K5829_14035 [Treponema sp.]|nr:hypothetical protein [Treponema sp.]
MKKYLFTKLNLFLAIFVLFFFASCNNFMQKSGKASFSISPKVLKAVSEKAILLEENQENLSSPTLTLESSTITVSLTGTGYSETKELSFTQADFAELEESEQEEIDIVFDDITVGAEISASAAISVTYSIGDIKKSVLVAEGNSEKQLVKEENNQLNLTLKSKKFYQRDCVVKFLFQTELDSDEYEENEEYRKTIDLGLALNYPDIEEILNTVSQSVKYNYSLKEIKEPEIEDYFSGEDLVYEIYFDKIEITELSANAAYTENEAYPNNFTLIFYSNFTYEISYAQEDADIVFSKGEGFETDNSIYLKEIEYYDLESKELVSVENPSSKEFEKADATVNTFTCGNGIKIVLAERLARNYVIQFYFEDADSTDTLYPGFTYDSEKDIEGTYYKTSELETKISENLADLNFEGYEINTSKSISVYNKDESCYEFKVFYNKVLNDEQIRKNYNMIFYNQKTDGQTYGKVKTEEISIVYDNTLSEDEVSTLIEETFANYISAYSIPEGFVYYDQVFDTENSVVSVYYNRVTVEYIFNNNINNEIQELYRIEGLYGAVVDYSGLSIPEYEDYNFDEWTVSAVTLDNTQVECEAVANKKVSTRGYKTFKAYKSVTFTANWKTIKTERVIYLNAIIHYEDPDSPGQYKEPEVKTLKVVYPIAITQDFILDYVDENINEIISIFTTAEGYDFDHFDLHLLEAYIDLYYTVSSS